MPCLRAYREIRDVDLFGAGVETPPVLSLTSNLRPGRLRAGPGVRPIVPLSGISHVSFQIANRGQEERGECEDDRDHPGDDEDECRPLALCQKCGGDRGDGCQQRSAEVIHAGDTTEQAPRHVHLQGGDPQDAEAREADPESRWRESAGDVGPGRR